MEETCKVKVKRRKENSLWKILKNKEFEYDEFFNYLPKDIWNLILIPFERKILNNLLLVSKSFFYFLHSNRSVYWKNLFYRFEGITQNYRECIFLPRFSHLMELEFYHCEINDIIFAEILDNQKHLSVIKFNYVKLDGKLQTLIDWIKPHLKLKSLTFRYNHLTEQEIQSLCEAIQLCLSIEEFRFDDYTINSKEAFIFAEFLRTNSSLKFFHISALNRAIETEGIKVLSESLKVNKTLEEITINWVALGGLLYINEVSKINKTLKITGYNDTLL